MALSLEQLGWLDFGRKMDRLAGYVSRSLEIRRALGRHSRHSCDAQAAGRPGGVS